MKTLIAKKLGMTRVYDKTTGNIVPVTIIQAQSNTIHQVKTEDKDGYHAIQLGFDPIRDKLVTTPLKGHFKKCNTSPTRYIKEFRIDEDEKFESGQTLGVEIFEGVKFVDIIGKTKGRGFSGAIKRHNFQRGRMSHGNTNRREIGSMGSNTFPAHVFPGKRMPGRYGNEQVTIKGLTIVEIKKEDGIILLKGAIPGPTNGIVFIRQNQTKY